MKKTIKYTEIIAAALLAVAPVVVSNGNLIQTVQANSTSKKLIHSAYVYNAKGKKIKKTALKKGHVVKVLSTKMIAGHKYVRISKRQYVRASNLANSKTKLKKTTKVAKRSNSKDPVMAQYENQLYNSEYGSKDNKKVVVVATKNTKEYSAGFDGKVEENQDSITIENETEFTVKSPHIIKYNGEYYIVDERDSGDYRSQIEDNYLGSCYKLSDVKITNYNPNKDTKMKALKKIINSMGSSYIDLVPKTRTELYVDKSEWYDNNPYASIIRLKSIGTINSRYGVNIESTKRIKGEYYYKFEFDINLGNDVGREGLGGYVKVNDVKLSKSSDDNDTNAISLTSEAKNDILNNN